MEETWRWYGPSDPITLSDIRQVKINLVFNHKYLMYNLKYCITNHLKKHHTRQEQPVL